MCLSRVPVSLCFCLCVHLSIYPCVCVCLCLFVPVTLFVCVSICLCVSFHSCSQMPFSSFTTSAGSGAVRPWSPSPARMPPGRQWPSAPTTPSLVSPSTWCTVTDPSPASHWPAPAPLPSLPDLLVLLIPTQMPSHLQTVQHYQPPANYIQRVMPLRLARCLYSPEVSLVEWLIS